MYIAWWMARKFAFCVRCVSYFLRLADWKNYFLIGQCQFSFRHISLPVMKTRVAINQVGFGKSAAAIYSLEKLIDAIDSRRYLPFRLRIRKILVLEIYFYFRKQTAWHINWKIQTNCAEYNSLRRQFAQIHNKSDLVAREKNSVLEISVSQQIEWLKSSQLVFTALADGHNSMNKIKNYSLCDWKINSRDNFYTDSRWAKKQKNKKLNRKTLKSALTTENRTNLSFPRH